MRGTQDEDNLREALRFSAAMLGELRTSLLTPQKYFELYMQASDELRHLEVSTRVQRPFASSSMASQVHCEGPLAHGNAALPCRRSSRRSTPRAGPMLISTSSSSTPATSCRACECILLTGWKPTLSLSPGRGQALTTGMPPG